MFNFLNRFKKESVAQLPSPEESYNGLLDRIQALEQYISSVSNETPDTQDINKALAELRVENEKIFFELDELSNSLKSFERDLERTIKVQRSLMNDIDILKKYRWNRELSEEQKNVVSQKDKETAEFYDLLKQKLHENNILLEKMKKALANSGITTLEELQNSKFRNEPQLIKGIGPKSAGILLDICKESQLLPKPVSEMHIRDFLWDCPRISMKNKCRFYKIMSENMIRSTADLNRIGYNNAVNIKGIGIPTWQYLYERMAEKGLM